MANQRRMTPEELAGIIDQQIADSTISDGNNTDDEWAIRFSEGEVDIPAQEGRSQVVSRDVADNHGLILPGLLRIFFASDRIAIYEPRRPEQEAYAQQATDLVNYVVLYECNGYRHLRDALSDGTLLGNGIVKHWWDSSPEYTVHAYTGQSDPRYRMLMTEPGVEELAHREYPDPDWVPPDPMTLNQALVQGAAPEQVAAMSQSPMLHDVKIRRLRSTGRLRLAALPREQFRLERSAKFLDENVRFCAHVDRRTRSSLVKEGYPKDVVDAIPVWTDNSNLEQARDPDKDGYDDDAPDRSTEYVEVYECYVLIDYDGDGIAERRRVVMAGNSGKRSLLANEEWEDDLPFSDIVPDPRAHTWRGRGLYDDLKDIQRIKTTVMRAMLDSTYDVMHPQRKYLEGSVVASSLGELANPTFGGLIAVNRMDAIEDLKKDHIGPLVAPVLEYMDIVAEKRTGLSRASLALDPDVLQNQSATAVNEATAAAHSKTEEYARNIAEHGGMKRIFACCLRLITKHQDRPKTIRLRGKLVEMDPRSWDAEMDVTINVGLGTGSRDRDLSMLQGVASKQELFISRMGPFNPICNIGHLFDTYRKIAEAAGMKNVDALFPEISQEQVKQMAAQAQQGQNQPDPKMIEAQANMQIEQQKNQFDMASKAAKQKADMEAEQARILLDHQARREENALRLQAIREENAAKLDLMREESAARIQLMRDEAHAKANARIMEMQLEAQLTEAANLTKMATARPIADTNITAPGGA